MISFWHLCILARNEFFKKNFSLCGKLKQIYSVDTFCLLLEINAYTLYRFVFASDYGVCQQSLCQWSYLCGPGG